MTTTTEIAAVATPTATRGWLATARHGFRGFVRWLTSPGVALSGSLVAMVVLAGAFVVSFTTLRDLAAEYGIPADVAWIWPVIVDGATVAATLVTFASRDLSGHERVLPVLILALFAGVSVFGNVVHDLIPEWPDGWELGLKIFVRSVPPVALFLTTHLFITLVQIVGRQDHADAADMQPAAVDTRTEAVTPTVDTAGSVATVAKPVLATAAPVTTDGDGDDAVAIVDDDAASSVDTESSVPLATVSALIDTDGAASPEERPHDDSDVELDVAVIPSDPQEQVAWIAERAQRGQDTSWRALAQLFDAAGQPLSDRTVQRRLKDARELVPEAFAA